MRALVIIPTYNEMENLADITAAVLAVPAGMDLDVLVVDDNSPDGTGALADALARDNPRIHVLHRPGKEGLGPAYMAGFAWALARDYDRVLEMDADFSHDPAYIPDFLAASMRADVVAGTRYKDGVRVINWPMQRLLLSFFASIYARLATGMPFSDLTSGFKCFTREALKRLDFSLVRSSGYSFQIEVTFMAWKRGLAIEEVPIVFTDRKKGVTKMSANIVLEALLLVLRFRLLGSRYGNPRA